MREFFTIAIFKIKADIRMNKTTLNSQKEKHFMLSLRRATVTRAGQLQSMEFLSTLSLRRATILRLLNRGTIHISIHALLAESDSEAKSVHKPLRISIHALLAESDKNRRGMQLHNGHFYPRSPCGERLHFDNYNLHCVEISIHALLAESDSQQPEGTTRTTYFYPRSPCGERRLWTILYSCPGNFYPRSPCGERQPAARRHDKDNVFLSTLSLRRATDAKR